MSEKRELRYFVSDKIEHSCCYEAAVRDRQDMSGPASYGKYPSLICECPDKETADRIARLLNMPDWNIKNSSLLPPFDNWPKWAIELDVEISDLIGDIGAKEEDDMPEGRAEIAAYERVRELIRSMV